MNKLGIVSTKDNIPEGSELYINALREYSSIYYLDDKKEWRRVREGTITNRPIHFSELSKSMKERGFNIGGKSWSKGGDLYIQTSISSENSPVCTISDGLRVSHNSNTDKTTVEKKLEEILAIPEYNKVLNEMDEREISLFSSIGSTIDIMTGVRTIDLITYNSDSYTNILSLVPLKRYIIQEGVSAKVDLGVQYVFEGDLRSHETTFCAFKYMEDNSGKLVLDSPDWIETVEDNIQIEFVNGILKTLPLSNNVSECIISNCTVTYGRLE